MSLFTGPIRVEHTLASWRVWQLLEPLRYEAGEEGSGRWIVVPAGFSFDGASVPRWLWALLPATGRYFRAAAVHDYLLSLLRGGSGHPMAPSRWAADREFRIACRACGVRLLIAWGMWAAVRIFGRV